MATVLLTWELGTGLGHMVPLLPIARGLRQRGHAVFASLRDLARAADVFDGAVKYLQAPAKNRPTVEEVRPTRSFAHVLHNVGWGEDRELLTMTLAWRNLYTLLRPDLIVFDHSPTAMLAARGWPARKVVSGLGFFIPPDRYPLPPFREWSAPDLEATRADEDRILCRANSVLAQLGEPPFERLGQLYSQVDECFLNTFPELDHYGPRPSTRYRGCWTAAGGDEPKWPAGPGKRVYAYLKPFPALPALLEHLNRLRMPTLVTPDGIDPEVQRRHASDTLWFRPCRVDHALVAQQCDVAILNANHGTLVHMLLAGKPTLNVPPYIEQGMLARRVRALGAGLDAPSDDAVELSRCLDELLSKDSFSSAARRFAEKYAKFDPDAQAARMIESLEDLLSHAHPHAAASLHGDH